MTDRGLGRIGLIGLGKVGTHFVDHLLAAGAELVVHDRAAAAMASAAGRGAAAAGSAREVAAASAALVLSLPSPAAARAVMLEADGVLAGAAPGTLVIDCSTIDPTSCIALHQAARARGVDYIEAPISGGAPGGAGTDGAAAASITFMVGGERAAYERARPILAALGSRCFHLGPAGAGSTVKLISNHIAGLNMLVMCEAFVLGAAAGFSWRRLLEVFEGTDAKSYVMMNYLAPRLGRRDFEPGFSVDLQLKDHRLAGELGRGLGVPLPLNDLAREVFGRISALGRGGKDHADAINVAAEAAGIDLFDPGTDE